jgi:UDP-GlcNAc:undecaprenyl-phosphate GlcNAc-1-phosphate transferase
MSRRRQRACGAVAGVLRSALVLLVVVFGALRADGAMAQGGTSLRVPDSITTGPTVFSDGLIGERVRAIGEQIARLQQEHARLERVLGASRTGTGSVGVGAPGSAGAKAAAWSLPASKLEIFSGYIGVMVAAFVVSVLSTPVMRRLAINIGVIDRPDEARKQHKFPIAYLGGMGVYLGILAGLAYYIIAERWPAMHLMTKHFSSWPDAGPGPIIAVIVGLTVILVVGLLDDVVNVAPLQKVGGVLIAAAALSTQDVGTRVAQQVLAPIGEWLGNPALRFEVLPQYGLTIDVVYWTGVAVIAIFCLGACNAMNLIDGLDGLCSGIGAIAAACILFIAVRLAAEDNGPLNGLTIVLAMAVLGGCLGFLPHNFNPAVIFLGDAGSLMLGYAIIALVLMLGHQGQTNLVLAGLVIFAVPIMDTALAIVRRKLAGQKLSAADDQHLHHMFKRALGVKGAVLVLYGIGGTFGLLGIILSESASRLTYSVVIVLGLFIGMTAIKVARRRIFEEQASKLRAAEAVGLASAGAAGTPNAGSELSSVGGLASKAGPNSAGNAGASKA